MRRRWTSWKQRRSFLSLARNSKKLSQLEKWCWMETISAEQVETFCRRVRFKHRLKPRLLCFQPQLKTRLPVQLLNKIPTVGDLDPVPLKVKGSSGGGCCFSSLRRWIMNLKCCLLGFAAVAALRWRVVVAVAVVGAVAVVVVSPSWRMRRRGNEISREPELAAFIRIKNPEGNLRSEWDSFGWLSSPSYKRNKPWNLRNDTIRSRKYINSSECGCSSSLADKIIC